MAPRIDRRAFLAVTSAGVVGLGCSTPSESDPGGDGDGDGDGEGDGDLGPDASAEIGVDAADNPGCPTASYRDTYAVALYFDGTIGPLTGVISTEILIANQPVDLDFWHGHGGQLHRFQIGPADYARLLAGERVMIETSEVDDHRHMLFIDPTDPEYAVPGAEPVEIEVCP